MGRKSQNQNNVNKKWLTASEVKGDNLNPLAYFKTHNFPLLSSSIFNPF